MPVGVCTNGGLTREEMEARRARAAPDILAGRRSGAICREFGISRTTLSRWSRKLRGNGTDAMVTRTFTPGRPSRLTFKQRHQLIKIWRQGPAAQRLPVKNNADGWTTQTFADVISIMMGVTYNPDHMGRLLLKLGLRQKRKYTRDARRASGVV